MKLKSWIGYVRWILLAVCLLAAGFCYSCGSGAGTEVSLAQMVEQKDSAEQDASDAKSDIAAAESDPVDADSGISGGEQNQMSCCCEGSNCRTELQRMTELLEAIAAGKEGTDPAKVNINTADRSALMTLPGIGGAKADAITEYRSQHGGFRTIDEIKKVPGVKDAAFQKIKDKITV